MISAIFDDYTWNQLFYRNMECRKILAFFIDRETLIILHIPFFTLIKSIEASNCLTCRSIDRTLCIVSFFGLDDAERIEYCLMDFSQVNQAFRVIGDINLSFISLAFVKSTDGCRYHRNKEVYKE